MPGPIDGHQVLRIAAQLPPHLADAFFHDALHRAPPSRVEDAHGLALAVGHNHRKAVGDLHSQQHARRVGDQPVARAFPRTLFLRSRAHSGPRAP